MVVELAKAEVVGWPALKLLVARRDRGCIAVQGHIFGRDVAPDLCRNGLRWIIPWNDPFQLEFDHVKETLGMSLRAPHDEAHGVAVCAWHHRLSKDWRSDSAEHRDVIRDYLARLYPAVWRRGGLNAT